MPTILDTNSISQCVISYGKEASFAGKLANVSIQVTPMAAGIGPIRLVWAATGDIFSPFTDSTSGDSGAPGIITLPRTDQDGFRHGTAAFKNWYYLAVVTATLADGQQSSRRYVFQTASSTLDLDMLDEDGVVAALPVIAPILAEPQGLSDATRASLSATYLPLPVVGTTPGFVGQVAPDGHSVVYVPPLSGTVQSVVNSDGSITVSPTTKYGLRADGTAYFSSGSIPSNEQAILAVNAAGTAYSLTRAPA